MAIVGGGIAGIAAAIRLAEAGLTPIVLETRKKLGGRATSFADPRTGKMLDNCQHVAMGCCVNLLDFYQRLGVLDRMQWHPATYWANPPHAPDEMRAGWLPAPAQFTGSFLRMRMISLMDKVAIARAMLKLMRLGFAGRDRWRGRVFLEFLTETRQTLNAIQRFWEPVVVSACNLPSSRVDAPFAMKVFQEGFLSHRFASQMALSAVPLLDLYDPAESIIAQAGGEVRLGVSAQAIAFDGRRATGVVTDEGLVDAVAVISTVPPDRLQKLCSPVLQAADARLQHLDEISTSPILGVHLVYETPVLKQPHLVLPARATQWLFNKGIDESGRQHIHAVISAADAWMELDEAEISRRVRLDIEWACPDARGREPVEVRSVKEKRATFAALPGFEALRPGPRPCPTGGVDNLILAGDWCDTGWPATMEGAVRSGYAAADAITNQSSLQADLPVAILARAAGLG
ncbi:MAG: hydroxysqualene dehydroxylase HpnE [Planctomycetes bacterium]|nr:hydroxysqualene dehydroxylase HpnE [Planctomycetota bacterium]